MRAFSLPFGVATVLLLAGTLAACSPKFNWRQFHASAPPFSVLFPDKPQTVIRPVDLDGLQVAMTMTAAEVDGVMFAVGAAEVANASLAPKALGAMKTALVNNISGTVIAESATAAARAGTGASARSNTIAVEARGHSLSGRPLLLIGHFFSRDKRVYQVIVLGPENPASRDNAETFLGSFRLD